MGSDKLRGFVGQSMSGRKSYADASLSLVGSPLVVNGLASGTITAAKRCTALIFAWGAGGAGFTDNSGNPDAGGGGAAALFKRVRMSAGQALTYSCPAAPTPTVDGGAASDGASATVTLPNGTVLTAGGGKGGSGVTGGVGGLAMGGDINRPGSDATGSTPGNPSAGANAGTLVDLGADFAGGLGGAASANGTAPGGGGGGKNGLTGTTAGAGRIIIALVAAR